MASRQVKKPVRKKETVRSGVSLLTDHDIYLFKEGNHFGLYNKLGSHVMTVEGMTGTLFAVWAPNASRVSVKGDFNGWKKDSHKLKGRGDASGLCEGCIPGDAAEDGLDGGGPGKQLERHGVDEGPPRTELTERSDHVIRDASGLVAARAGGGEPLAHLPRDG